MVNESTKEGTGTYFTLLAHISLEVEIQLCVCEEKRKN